jgi:hypothetical protein
VTGAVTAVLALAVTGAAVAVTGAAVAVTGAAVAVAAVAVTGAAVTGAAVAVTGAAPAVTGNVKKASISSEFIPLKWIINIILWGNLKVSLRDAALPSSPHYMAELATSPPPLNTTVQH